MVIQYKASSPYYKTNQKTDIVSYLDFINYIPIQADDTDIAMTVDNKFNERPDLLSNSLYGTPNLWWIFIVRNPDQMVDPIYGLTTGLEIYVPTKERIFSLLGL